MKIIITKNTEYDEFIGYYFFLSLFLFTPILVDIVREVPCLFFYENPMPAVLNSIVGIVRNILYGISILYFISNLLVNGLRNNVLFIFTTSIITIVYSCLLDSSIASRFSEDIAVFLFRVVLGMVYFSHVRDMRRLLYMIIKWAPVMFIYSIIAFLLGRNEYYLSISYYISPFAALYLIYGYENNHKEYSVLGMWLFAEIFLYGSRMAFFSAGLAVFLYLIFRKSSIRKIFSIICLGIVLLIVYLHIDSIVLLLLRYFGDSRTLSFIISDNVMYDGGRSIIRQIVTSKLTLFPHGVFTDRFIVNPLMKDVRDISKAYTHNFILEVLYQHGIIVGGFLVLLWCFVIIKSFIIILRSSNSNRMVYFSLVVSFVVKSMISTSYLIDYMFGVSMGICLAVILNNGREFEFIEEREMTQ